MKNILRGLFKTTLPDAAEKGDLPVVEEFMKAGPHPEEVKEALIKATDPKVIAALNGCFSEEGFSELDGIIVDPEEFSLDESLSSFSALPLAAIAQQALMNNKSAGFSARAAPGRYGKPK